MSTTNRTPAQLEAFRARLKAGLALVPTDMSRIEWGYRRDKQSDLQELYPVPVKPVVLPHSAPQPINLADYQQLKGQVNFLNNKMTEMRAERKKKDDGAY